MNITAPQTLQTQKNLIIGFVFILFFIISAGICGMYSLYKSRLNSQEYINAVDSAREVQVLLQKQIQVWKTNVIEGDDFDQYQILFYLFSQYSSTIQDRLFNLKIICIDFGKVSEDIQMLIDQHKSVSQEYIHYLVELQESRFTQRERIVQQAKDKDQRMLRNIDSIVVKIKSHAFEKIDSINRVYLIIVFVIFSVMILLSIGLSVYLTRRIVRSHYILERNVARRTSELVEVNRQIKLSEKKYRLIVEGSNDIIFSLDDSFHFITANSAIKKYLKLDPDKIQGMDFFELIHEGMNGTLFNNKFIMHQMQNIKKADKTVQFMVDLKNPSMIESILMKIKMQYIDIEGEKEFLGSAETVTRDSFLRSVVKERRMLAIDNSLIIADDISQRLTACLNNVMNSSESKLVRIALREIIINAIEHGNLAISYDEKSETLMQDTYFSLINSRKQDPRYEGRKVIIDYSFDREKVVYRIIDQGDGFDTKSLLERSDKRQNDEEALHGRGISMAKQIFDTIKYNRKGNQVLLVKHFDA